MIEWKEYSAKTVAEAIELAESELGYKPSESDIEVLEKESSGFLGIIKKGARIRVKAEVSAEASCAQADAAEEKKETPVASEPKVCKDPVVAAKEFLSEVFKAMEIEAEVIAVLDSEGTTVEVQVNGDDMGILIGKRGQTLDSLQYLTSLVINKGTEGYIKVKLDTENYRERRKETLENLASNIAVKVKRSHKPVSLEPMNPYERRIIHSALQNDKFVETHSEGEEPYRKVVVTPKKGVREYNNRYGRKPYDKKYNNNRGGYGKKYTSSKEFHKRYGADTKDYSTDYKKDYAAYLESKAAAKAEAEKASSSEENK